MRISELNYDTIARMLGECRFNMPEDESDALREISSEKDFSKAKKKLMDHFGDVEISIHPDAPWYDKVKIEDEKYKAAFDEYCNKKSKWCEEYGCD